MNAIRRLIPLHSACRGAFRLMPAMVIAILLAGFAFADDPEIDWNKARELRRQQQSGQKLSAEDEAYLKMAIEARRKLQSRPRSERPESAEARTSLDLTPLTDFSADEKYKGHGGGLYGEGKNEPPQEHLAAALKAAGAIQPLDAAGQPDEGGKIVMISNGMSNTTAEFQAFIQLARQDKEMNPRLVIVDAAQGGQEASDWANPADRARQENRDPWEVQAARLKAAGVTPQQVQVVWMKQARRNPASLGDFPKHAQQLQQNQADVLVRLKETFPNLKLAYLSSRIYAGYAESTLNPEPYAYESAWANQWLIREQTEGKPELNYDPSKGEVKAPVILWGPYLWADGLKGRDGDKLIYEREDLARDGTHPSNSGRKKVAGQLLEFFKSDPTARPWFVREGAPAPSEPEER